MFDFVFLALVGIYLQIVIVRDKKYRKEMQRIAKQQRRKKVIVQYVPANTYNVVSLSDFRRKRSAGNVG